MENVRLMPRTTVTGAYDGGTYGALERVGHHRPRDDARRPRECFWRIVARRAILCAGALEVVKGNKKYDNVLSYGVDGTAEAVLLIKEGKMTSTSLQNAYDLAAKNIKVAHDILTGKIKQVDTDIDCPLITRDNVDDYIEIHKKAGAIQ